MASNTDMLEDLVARIAAAPDAAALEAERVAALGKQGAVTQLLKSLGAMSAEQRQAEGPRIHALREAVAEAIASRKAALENAALERRLATETLDLTLPSAQGPQGSVHPVSQVMDELAEIFADLGFSVATGPRSRTTGATSRRSTFRKAIPRGRCTTPSISRRR
jgi:phenylalanyl-tRNA synthetase alpha chain